MGRRGAACWDRRCIQQITGRKRAMFFGVEVSMFGKLLLGKGLVHGQCFKWMELVEALYIHSKWSLRILFHGSSKAPHVKPVLVRC